MAWLDSLLAFAVTMMVLSTMVSIIVETGHSLLNQRAKGLEALMRHIFEKAIAPQLAGRLPTDLTGSRFVKQMTDLRWLPIESNAPKWKKVLFAIGSRLRRSDKAQKLTTLEFLERLAESPVGAALLDRSKSLGDDGKALSVFVEDLANKFEAFGEDASAYFARRARMYSVLIGFILVFSINFSAIDVARTLLQSDEARSALIEQGDEIAERLSAQLATEAETIRAASESAEPGTAPPEFDTEEFSERLQNELGILEQAQLPIGWRHAPWQATPVETQEDPTSFDRFKAWFSLPRFVGWFSSVFIAGLLVGLGGPFWFDTYRKLSALSSIAKVFQSEVKREDESAETTASQDDRRSRFVRIFNTARQASSFAKAGGRVALSNDGQTIPLGHIR